MTQAAILGPGIAVIILLAAAIGYCVVRGRVYFGVNNRWDRATNPKIYWALLAGYIVVLLLCVRELIESL